MVFTVHLYHGDEDLMDIAEYFSEDELVLSEDPEPFDELPHADLLVLTSGYLKTQDNPAFLEYAKTLSKSHVIILYKDFSDLESIVNIRDLDYVSWERKNELKQLGALYRSRYEGSNIFKDQIKTSLENTKAYWVYSVPNGMAIKYRDMELLPGTTDYEQSRITKEVLELLRTFEGETGYRTGVRVINEKNRFYSVMILAFSKENPASTDPRLREESLFALCINVPQPVIVQLPRDETLTHLVDFSKDVKSPISREDLEKYKIYVCDKIYGLICEGHL